MIKVVIVCLCFAISIYLETLLNKYNKNSSKEDYIDCLSNCIKNK